MQSGDKGGRGIMKVVYCANCGTRLNVLRKALPKYAKIIDIVEYHECPNESVEIDLTPVDIPPFDIQKEKGKNKFVQKLNDLQPSKHFDIQGTEIGRVVGGASIGALSTADLRDRRKSEEVKSDIDSTAPNSVLGQLKSMQNTTPANDISKEPKDA